MTSLLCFSARLLRPPQASRRRQLGAAQGPEAWEAYPASEQAWRDRQAGLGAGEAAAGLQVAAEAAADHREEAVEAAHRVAASGARVAASGVRADHREEAGAWVRADRAAAAAHPAHRNDRPLGEAEGQDPSRGQAQTDEEEEGLGCPR